MSPISIWDYVLGTPPEGADQDAEPSAAYKAAAAKGQDMFAPMPELVPGQNPYADIIGTWKASTPQTPDGLYVGKGPNGQDMGFAQKGWDNYGNPYYGEGFKGWLIGSMAKMVLPAENANKNKIDMSSFSFGDFMKTTGPLANIDDKSTATGYERAMSSTTLDIGGIAKAAGSGEFGTLPAYVGKAASFVISDVVLTGFTWASKKLEQGLAVGSDLTEEAPITALVSPGAIAGQMAKRVLVEGQSVQDAWNGFFEKGQFQNLRDYVDNSFAITPGKGIRVEKYGPLDLSWQSGQILYSTFFEPTLREQYKAAYKAGKNPYLLAQELENPVAEALVDIAIGFTPLDPVSWMGTANRALRETGRMTDAYKAMIEPVEALKNIFKTSDGSVKVLEFADNLDDAAAVQKITDAVNLFANRLDEIANPNNRGFFSLTATGERDKMMRTTGNFLQWVVNSATSGKNLDDKMEALKYLSYLGSKDPEKITEAFSYLRRAEGLVAPSTFLSEHALQTGMVLNKMLGKEDDIIKAFSEAQKLAQEAGNPKPIIDLAMKRMGGAVKEIFPTMTEAAGNSDKLIAAGKAGQKIDPLKLSLARVDVWSRKYIYKVPNTILTGLYLGASMGYAVKNAITNTFHIAVDEGIAAVNFNLGQLNKGIASYLGGTTPAAVAGISRGTMGEEVAGIAEKMPFTQLANWFETVGARQVVYSSVRRTMNTLLREGRALPDAQKLIDAGMNPAAARELINLAIANKGDVGEAVKAFRKGLSSNFVETFRTLEGMGLSRADLDILAKDGLRDMFQDALTKGADKSEVLKLWEDAVNSYEKQAMDLVKNDAKVPAIDPTNPEVQQVIEMLERGGDTFTEEMKALVAHHIGANSKANQTALELMTGNDGFLAGAVAQAKANNPELVDAIQTIKVEFEAFLKACAEGDPSGTTLLQKHGIQGHMAKEFTPFWKTYADAYASAAKNGEVKDWMKAWDDTVNTINGKYEGFGTTSKLTSNTYEAFRNAFYEQFFFPYQRSIWTKYRDVLNQNVVEAIGKINEMMPVEQSDVVLKQIQDAYKLSTDWDAFLDPRMIRMDIHNAIKAKDMARLDELLASTGVRNVYPDLFKGLDNAERQVLENAAGKAGIELTPASRKMDRPAMLEFYGMDNNPKHIVNATNKYLGLTGDKRYKNVSQITDDVLEEALKRRASDKGIEIISPIGERQLSGVVDKMPITADLGSAATPSLGRAMYNNLDGLKKLHARMNVMLNNAWGTTHEVASNPNIEAALVEWEKLATGRVAQARLIATQVADEARNFTLLAYGQKRVPDLMLSYVYPYSFWYTRTYMNWMKRIAYNPEVVSAYAEYKNMMGKIHAGAPEWYKYQINTNELFGMESDNPLFFNLEATLNPMYGLTGADFNDSDKRVDTFTKVVDDMGKLGPSIWSPFTWAIGMEYYRRGEEETGAKWLGRMIPQTNILKSALSLAGVTNKTGQGFNEYDPWVNWFSNGMDPYERNRVARTLGMMTTDGSVSEIDAIDAAYNQSGPIWEQAYNRMMMGTGSYLTSRAFSQLAGSTVGVGFKGRSVTDMQIDRYYQDKNRLINMGPDMTPDEWRQGWASLKNAYPFADVIELARKGGVERDTALAYNVLSRIPPGQSDNVANAIGVPQDLLSKFWDTKGAMQTWKPGEADQFMGGVVRLNSLLAMPDDATKDEWNVAKALYADMNVQAQELFGTDIMKKVDAYWASKNAGKTDMAKSMLDANPEIGQYFNWKSSYLLNDPTLAKYYASLGSVEDYYKGQVYNALEARFGADIYNIQTGYFDLKNIGGDYKAYLKEHPELIQYWEASRQYQAQAAKMYLQVRKLIPKAPPPELIPGAEGTEEFQQGLEEQEEVANPAYDYSWDDFSEMTSPPIARLLKDHFENGDRLTDAVDNEIERLAEKLGVSKYVLMELMRKAELAAR